MNVRILAPASVASVVANGRTYTATAGLADVPDFDAAVACSNGWQRLENVGTTAQRPVLGTDQAGQRFIDTTIGAVIVWTGAAWRNVVTGAAV